METIIANPNSLSPDRKAVNNRNANSHFAAWEERTALVKQQTSAESAANDAKTIRLRALRLEKEKQDAEAARIAAENAPPPAPRKRAPKAG